MCAVLSYADTKGLVVRMTDQPWPVGTRVSFKAQANIRDRPIGVIKGISAPKENGVVGTYYTYSVRITVGGHERIVHWDSHQLIKE